MAASVKSVQTHQSAENKRKIIVEEQYPVFCAYEGPGDPDEETAVHVVETLGQMTVEPC